MPGRIETARMLADYSLMSEEELVEYIANTIDVRIQGLRPECGHVEVRPNLTSF